jgi:pilus assembly protein TadC
MVDLNKRFEEYRRKKERKGPLSFLKTAFSRKHEAEDRHGHDGIHEKHHDKLKERHAHHEEGHHDPAKHHHHHHHAHVGHVDAEQSSAKKSSGGLFAFFKRKAPIEDKSQEIMKPKEVMKASDKGKDRATDALERKYKELFKDEAQPSMFSSKKVDIDHELDKLKGKKRWKADAGGSPDVKPKKGLLSRLLPMKRSAGPVDPRKELESLEKDEKVRKCKQPEPESKGMVAKIEPQVPLPVDSSETVKGDLHVTKHVKGHAKNDEPVIEPEEPKHSKKATGKAKDSTEVHSKDIRMLFRKKAKAEKRKVTSAELRRRLADYIEKAGLETDPAAVTKGIFNAALILTTLVTAIYVYLSMRREATIVGIFIQVGIIWLLGFVFLWGLCWLVFRIYLDLLMFRRKLSVEEVLPDFLQLTSANLRAGMPIDRALWFAVRPRFGVLAKEIEDVAKRTLTGEDLGVALVDFAKKYDSAVLLRSVHLLNEGMEAGGDIADLLNKIAINIQDMRAMKKEMSANVTTYVIFITFASLIAAPFLFGLSQQLLYIVQSIAGDVAKGGVQRGVGLTINLSSSNVKMSDYKTFAYSCLVMSSFFSAVIVATIRKGNVREGLHYIPIFILVSTLVFTVASWLMGLLFGQMF